MFEKNQGMLSKLLIIVALFFSMVSFSSCKDASEQNHENIEAPSADKTEEVILDGAFVKFYNEFHADSIFQWDHIAFPLKNNHEEEIGAFWTRENWKRHNAFTDMGGMFRRDFEVLGNIVIEKIIDANGFFQMERRFANLSTGWNLIFYSVENPNINEE